MGWIQAPRAGDPNRSTWARSSPGDGVLFPPGRPELASRDELLREEARLRHRLDQLDLEAALLQREQARRNRDTLERLGFDVSTYLGPRLPGPAERRPAPRRKNPGRISADVVASTPRTLHHTIGRILAIR